MQTRKNVVVYEETRIGKEPVIEDFVILGKPPRGFKPGELELAIGDYPIIRSGTIIYAGNIIGNKFETGDYARIRENNIIGDDVRIGSGSVIERECKIGDYARIHSRCFIPGYTVLEDNVWIGPGVTMTNVLHPPCPAFKKYAPIRGKKCCNGPLIKKNAVLGAGSIILPDVIVGENALVAAGSVVVDNVGTRQVVAGNPANVVKSIGELSCPIGIYRKGEVYSWRKK